MRTIRSTKVCVVGGAGFLGSHLVDHLIEDRDCEVLVLDNLITGKLKFVHSESAFEYCDITSSESYLRRLFAQYQIRYVFNYAAEPYVPLSFERPIHIFNVNAFGAIKVINAAEESGCEGILQVSSAEIYGDQRGKITEEAPVTPHSSYGASKAAIDFLVQSRWKESGTPCIALRQFNCVGERETHPYVVPEIISQLSMQRHNIDASPNQRPVVRLGNNSSRDFQYAGDAVRIAVALLEGGEFGEVYNMGSEESIGIYDLARLLASVMEFETVEIHQEQSRVRPWEIWHLQSDNSKLRKVIGRNLQKTPLRESLEKTVDYFNQNGEKWGW